MPVWYNPFGSLSAADIWTRIPRDLTDYHVSSGSTINTIAAGASLAPNPGLRFNFVTPQNANIIWEGYDTAWRTLATFANMSSIYTYQKIIGVGTMRFRNGGGAAVYYGMFYEDVGASKRVEQLPNDILVLERRVESIIYIEKARVNQLKSAIQTDKTNELGYKKYEKILKEFWKNGV